MHHRTTTTAITLILIACLLLTGCSAETLQKNRLRQDPLYTATWDGIESLGTEESTEGAWKPPPPSITRCLKTTLPPRRSSTKNHDNRRTRKLDRRRINPRVRNQQMGPEESPGRNATSICFSIGVGMHAIPRNESDHASRNCRQLTRPHPGPLISTKETNRPSTVFAIPLDLT